MKPYLYMTENAYEQSVYGLYASTFADIAPFFPGVESSFVYAVTDQPNISLGRMFVPQLGITEYPVSSNSYIALASILNASANNLTNINVHQTQHCGVKMTVENETAQVKANCCLIEFQNSNAELSCS